MRKTSFADFEKWRQAAIKTVIVFGIGVQACGALLCARHTLARRSRHRHKEQLSFQELFVWG